MSRALLPQRPHTCPRTSRPHQLWVHPGVRGGAGVPRLISCSCPHHPALRLRLAFSRKPDHGVRAPRCASKQQQVTNLPERFALTCLALKPAPPSQMKTTRSSEIPNRTEAGLLQGAPGHDTQDAGRRHRRPAVHSPENTAWQRRRLSPLLGTQQARSQKELSLEALSHRSWPQRGAPHLGLRGRPPHTPAGVREHYRCVCDAREIIMPARAAMSNKNGPPHWLSTQQGPDAGLNV